MVEQLTVGEAFEAMRRFLIQFNERERSESIDLVLAWTSIGSDGGTSDPAQWHDWVAAVEATLAQGGSPT